MDAPAYRYQRILYSLLARALALGDPASLPWVFLVLGILSQAAGTWMVALILSRWKVNPWYALFYGLWIGFALAVRLDLVETLAFALAAGGLLAFERNCILTASLLFLLAKEVTAAFWLAAVLDQALTKQGFKRLAMISLVPGIPYALFQFWLLEVFGRFGLFGVGTLSAPFQVIPFFGLWLVWTDTFFSTAYKTLIALLFIPEAVLPSIWGVWVSIKRIYAGQRGWPVWALFINALAIVPLPYTVFNDLRGMLRFLCGPLLAILLYLAYYRPAKAKIALALSYFFIEISLIQWLLSQQ